MPKKYTPEQFWELYKSLPQELKDALFAEETGNDNYEICKRNGIEENLAEIVEYTGRVLLGVLQPADFQEVLEKELNLEKELAKKVSQEINRFIFYPMKSSLEGIYKKEIMPTAKPTKITPPPEEKPPTPPLKDVYRESIE